MSRSQTTFAKLMALEAARRDDTFMSKLPAWVPGGRATYGGHVYAQAVWAASQTVGEGFVVHNVHGHFTLPGLDDRPFIYTVSRTGDGRSYSTRIVTVRQPVSPSIPPSSLPTGPSAATAGFASSDGEKELGKICFLCTCAFKRDAGEAKGPAHQELKNLDEEYAVVLKGKRPGDHPLAPQMDAPWYHAYALKYPQPDTFPGLEIRKVNMTLYNNTKPPISYRQLSYYRAYGSIQASEPNLHACAHLYASDRNSLFVISRALGFGDDVAKMASLSHSVVFHVDSRSLLFTQGEGGWFCQEAWTPRSGGGRGIHESKIWDERGLHIASSWQEGLVKKQDEGREQSDWESPDKNGKETSRHKL